MNPPELRSVRFRKLLAVAMVATASIPGCGGEDVRPSFKTDRVARPTFSKSYGPLLDTVTITMSSATPGASIHYTTDPINEAKSDWPEYSAPVVFTPLGLYDPIGATVFAIAVAAGKESEISDTSFTLMPQDPTPIFSPGTGTYSSPQVVTISCLVPGASIHYTLDGSTPTPGGWINYTAPIAVDAPTTIRAIATLNYESTPVATATYSF